MQELISKEAVLRILNPIKFSSVIELWKYTPLERDIQDKIKWIEALPTIVHHEYKVGDRYEFSDDWKNWFRWILTWFQIGQVIYDMIRPLQSEHPDITQARELASKHWMILIPKE